MLTTAERGRAFREFIQATIEAAKADAAVCNAAQAAREAFLDKFGGVGDPKAERYCTVGASGRVYLIALQGNDAIRCVEVPHLNTAAVDAPNDPPTASS